MQFELKGVNSLWSPFPERVTLKDGEIHLLKDKIDRKVSSAILVDLWNSTALPKVRSKIK